MKLKSLRVILASVVFAALLACLSSCNKDNDPVAVSSSPQYSVEGLEIPPPDIAKKLTAELVDNAPGTVGYVSPMNYDLKLAIKKGLCTKEGFGEKYLYMQALYRKVFESWLLETTSLREFNDTLRNHELDFVSVPEEDQDFYQRYTTMDLEFVYLCNNIPIERLSPEDLALLLSAIESGTSAITPELTEMVKRTFSDVLMAFPHLDDNNGCGYGWGRPPAPNRSIVLAIKEYPFDENEDWRTSAEQNKERREFTEALALEMQKTLTEELGHRVEVIVE